MTLRPVQVLLLGLAIAAGASAAVGTARADVSKTPVTTRCPAGYAHLSVDSFHPPYYRPPLVDAAGNNNGYICALAQPEAVAIAFCRQGASVACQFVELGLPHYLFKDDDSPASQT